MADASAAGKEFNAEHLKVYKAMTRTQGATKKLVKATQKIGVETQKTGKMFGWGAGKIAKFAGAVGLGVYSMYSLASAIRRGFHAIVDFAKDGIGLALKKHKELASVIDRNVNQKLTEMKTKLGEQVLPALVKTSKKIGELLDTLKETGVIDTFGTVLIDMLGAVAEAAKLAAGAIKGVAGAIAWVSEKSTGRMREAATAITVEQAEKQKELIKAQARKEGVAITQEEIIGLIGAGVGLELQKPEKYRKKGLTIKGMLPAARKVYEEYGGTWEAQKEMGRDRLLEEYGSYLRGEPGPYSLEMYKRFGLPVPGEEKAPAGRAARKGKEYYGPRGRVPALYEMEVYAEQRETEFARETKGWERREELMGLAKGLKKKTAKIREEVEAEALKNAMKRADVAAAHTKMMTQGIINAVRSGDVSGAFANLAINFATNIATDLAAALVKQQVLKALGFAIPGFQETGHIPGHVSGMPVVVHGGEFILKEAQLKALQAGYGIEGGRPGFDYKIPPAPTPVVEVNVAPGMDADIQTAYRARAGEAQLAQLEG